MSRERFDEVIRNATGEEQPAVEQPAVEREKRAPRRASLDPERERLAARVESLEADVRHWQRSYAYAVTGDLDALDEAHIVS